MLQVADTVAVQRGAHLLKAGADLLVNRATIEFPGAARGSYTFTSLPNLERVVYQQYQQAFGDTRVDQFNPNLGLFVQDEWTLHARVTVNAGVRYDLQWLPDPIALDVNNVSPRIGAAWTTADATLVVRASAGSYFDRIPLRATSNALQRDGERYRVAVLSFGEDAAPVFPHVLAAFPADQVSAITTIDPDVPNGRSDQVGLQVERALGGVASVSAGYSRVRGRRILMSRNVNVPTLTASQAASLGVPNLGRPDARFANVSRYEAIGDSWFNGLTLSLHTLARDWGSVRVSYTLSEAVDTAGNAFFSSPQDNFNVAAEKGPSDNDQRHRLVVSGAIGGAALRQGALAALGGVELGYVASYATGVPFNVLAGSDLNGDTSNNDRPPGVGRNSGRQSATSTLDLRLSRTFFLRGGGRLQAMIEAFNVLNHVNVIVVNNTFGTDATPRPGFGRPTLAGDARQLQLGIRWTF